LRFSFNLSLALANNTKISMNLCFCSKTGKSKTSHLWVLIFSFWFHMFLNSKRDSFKTKVVLKSFYLKSSK
jgi:hypothetical protein